MRLANIFSIEAGEATFSLAIRICRANDIALSDLLGASARHDLTGLRDFPLSATAIEMYGNTRFSSQASLYSAHSAVLYYATTIPEPFRSEEIERSLRTVDAPLRLSIGTTWSYARYCRLCAQDEYRNFHYSWWHRDHQLPLECFCAVHACRLTRIPLTQLNLNMPHELCGHCYSDHKEELARCDDIGMVVNRLERYLASGNRRSYLEAEITQTKGALDAESHDPFEQAEIACTSVKSVVLKLVTRGNREAIDDADRLMLGIKKLLRDGLDYADPVAASLLILSPVRRLGSKPDFSV